MPRPSLGPGGPRLGRETHCVEHVAGATQRTWLRLGRWQRSTLPAAQRGARGAQNLPQPRFARPEQAGARARGPALVPCLAVSLLL